MPEQQDTRSLQSHRTQPEPEPETTLGELLDVLASSGLGSSSAEKIRHAVHSMIEHTAYPCLGAKSVFRRDGAVQLLLDDLTADDAAGKVRQGLEAFAELVEQEDSFHSFVATFRHPTGLGEQAFEEHLWGLLQRIHDGDDRPWSADVSADPTNPHFAFSVAGSAYFVVGLHPAASRIARRAPLPTIVFNPHEQFEVLRGTGQFERMRDTIRRRDRELQGTINPMVADHGASSEAIQYSGRRHSPGWEPPLKVHEPKEGHS
jgi:FPC/CPF motif-containing protein YcgG